MMKNRTVPILRKILLVIGLTLIFISSALPITQTITFVGSDASLFDNYDYLTKPQVHELVLGFQSTYWQVISSLALLIFAVGYIKHKELSQGLIVALSCLSFICVLSLVLSVPYFFINKGPVVQEKFRVAFFLTFLGGILVIVSRYFYVFRKRKEVIQMDLLDSES